ncbi:hypothetical protein QL285_025467 [Trifolium repens]|nr:hypothetical protein QL285_025467 [Trifolium repens]
MSMELETGLHGVTRPKPDLESEQDLSDEDQFSSDSDSEEDPKLSPYDDIPSPPPFIPMAHRKCGIRSIAPLEINDETDEDYGLRPLLTDYSMAALDHYNKGSGASFEYVDLVKCNFFRDVCRSASMHAYADPDRDPDEYYITFKAKAKGDPSTTIFQATVSVDVLHENKCRIQI